MKSLCQSFSLTALAACVALSACGGGGPEQDDGAWKGKPVSPSVQPDGKPTTDSGNKPAPGGGGNKPAPDDGGSKPTPDDGGSKPTPDDGGSKPTPDDGGTTTITGADFVNDSWKVEFAQTHVVARSGGTKLAPVQTIGRQTLLLFTPGTSMPAGMQPTLDIKLSGKVVSSTALNPPASLPANLEDKLTSVKLQPYSTAAWSVVVPAQYMTPAHTLAIRYGTGKAQDVTPLSWASPASFTIGRVSVLLWPTSVDPTTGNVPVAKLAQDYYGSITVANLNYFDYTPLKLDYLVAQAGTNPPKKYLQFADATADGAEDLYNAALKPAAIRVSMANTGLGLLVRDRGGKPIYGDSSPYSFGTYVGIGWYYDAAKGAYADANVKGVSGGWSGWAATWNGPSSQCGYIFAHEIGHSLSLAHSYPGSSATLGITSEYPNDGVNGPNNPWGFDTTRNLFRTWYRVDAKGPVYPAPPADQTLPVGKSDPMNGVEQSNAITCYPQFVAYQAKNMQNWLDATPTLMTQNGTPGLYAWNKTTHAYEELAIPTVVGALTPAKLDVPVVTLLGTLTASTTDGTSQIYPPIYAKSGNVFNLPNPFSKDLPPIYTDARYFIRVMYADGSVDYALIPEKEITDLTQLDRFSLNLEFNRQPTQVQLYHARTGYPAITEAASDLIFTRTLSLPALNTLPEPARRTGN
ncbi:M66 family metalloprotease [Paraburkholderia bonniea]|uniref:M66 family metalloprotease n=1 Tax=Paraburkholderia bonniea TaxID=2152891 RepID=UPI0025735600|nr:M66 family metalloprotease [Paraburkholderia bonniea]WJF90260.1 M66 family metalloprotease [Paraburkholderia bonniea]WJF93575.1 M66 family metalloprotease [Paraburkholderia bonniea]